MFADTDCFETTKIDTALACNSLVGMAQALRTNAISAADLLAACLARIEAAEDTLHTFVTVTPDRARSDAERADAELSSGDQWSWLQAIPYGLKDNLNTAGIRTTSNSRVLWQNIPGQDSIVAARMKAAGGVLAGKLSMDEFALGGRSQALPSPPVCNPWNIGHATGGSSSGSSAAVAAGLLPVAIGSDTGGSTHIPAAYCGVLGVKPTSGLIDRTGMYPLSPTLDHCGLQVRGVRDAAAVLPILAGSDVTVNPYLSAIDRAPAGLRIGILQGFFDGARQPPELTQVMHAIRHGRAAMGASVSDIDGHMSPEYDVFRAASAVIMLSEAYTVHKANPIAWPERYPDDTTAARAGCDGRRRRLQSGVDLPSGTDRGDGSSAGSF